MGNDIVVFLTNTPLLEEIDLKNNHVLATNDVAIGKKRKLLEFTTKFLAESF